MKKTFITIIAVLASICAFAQKEPADVEIAYMYMDNEGVLWPYYVLTNNTPDDEITSVEFVFKVYTSKSNIKRGYYDYAPLYSRGMGFWDRCYKDCSNFGSIFYPHLVPNETIYSNSILNHKIGCKLWKTTDMDAVGIRILSVTVTFHSVYNVKLKGFPKNVRLRKDGDILPTEKGKVKKNKNVTTEDK